MKEAMKKEEINVLYGFDERFSIVAYTSVYSLLVNNQNLHVNIYIMSDGVSIEKKRLFDRLIDLYDVDIIWEDATGIIDELKEHGVAGYGATLNNGLTAYMRIFMANILPAEIEKILYLDSDTIVMGSIAELLSESVIGDAVLAMAVDTISCYYKKFIGLKKTDKYFNSGVMVVNCKKWRSMACQERLMSHVSNVRNNYPLFEQDLFNIVLHDEIKQLSSKYNCQSQMFLYEYSGFKSVYGLDSENWVSAKDFERAKTEPIIIHFCGNTFIRPWYPYSKHPLRELYEKYRSSLEISDDTHYGKVPVYYWIQYYLWRLLPSSWNIFVGKILQDAFMRWKYGENRR